VAKVRVYELAKELGIESKVVMTKLTEMGEFVRSASSTVEPPVVRKLREIFPAPATDAAPAPKPAKKAAASAQSDLSAQSATPFLLSPLGKASELLLKHLSTGELKKPVGFWVLRCATCSPGSPIIRFGPDSLGGGMWPVRSAGAR